MIRPHFVDHLVVRVADPGKIEHFYTSFGGERLHRTQESIMYSVGDPLLFFARCDGFQPRVFDKEEVGLSHFAFDVRQG